MPSSSPCGSWRRFRSRICACRRIAGSAAPKRASGGRPLYDLARGLSRTAGVYDRSRLGAGDRITGPAIVEQYDSTTVVLAGQALTVDDIGNLLIAEQTP